MTRRFTAGERYKFSGAWLGRQNHTKVDIVNNVMFVNMIDEARLWQNRLNFPTAPPRIKWSRTRPPPQIK